MKHVLDFFNGLTPAQLQAYCGGFMAFCTAIMSWRAAALHKELKDTKAMILKIELSVNGRMDALITATRDAATALGVLEGRAQQKQEHLDIAVGKAMALGETVVTLP